MKKILSLFVAGFLSISTAVYAGNSGALKPDLSSLPSGDVVGPGVGGSTDNAVARFNGVDGNIQNSGVLLSDLNSLSGLLDVLMSGLLKFQAGQAITAGEYQIGRDADATNQLHFNTPTGASFEFSVNDVPEFLLNSSTADFQNNGITTTGLVTSNGLSESALATWTAGEAVTAGNYQFGRNADATNAFEANVPAGASHKWSIAGVSKLSLSNNSNRSLLELNAAAGEDPFFRISDNDVAHGMTAFVPTNTIFEISPYSSATGPVNIKGASQGDNPGLAFTGAIGSLSPSSTTASFIFDAEKQGIGGAITALASHETAIAVYSVANQLLSLKGGALLGIGTNAPVATIHAQQAQTTFGTPTIFKLVGANNTNMTASNEAIDIDLNISRTINYATGNLAFHRVARLVPPRIGFAGASTVTEGATFSIVGAPTPGSNATFTNNSSLLLEAGNTGGSTNSYGLTVNANTGATNNYAARFLGGAVGFGTSAPLYPAQFSGTPTNGAAVGITPAAAANGDSIIFGNLPSVVGNLWGVNFTATATGSFLQQVSNANNASATANAVFKAMVAGASGGDPITMYTVSGVTDWTEGVDNSDSDSYKVSSSSALGTNDRLILSTGGEVRVPGTTRLDGRVNLGKGTTTAAASSLTLPTDGHLISISGTTTINLIDSTNWRPGSEVRLQFLSAGCTVANNQAPSGAFAKILVTGSGNYVSTAMSQALLVYDGTNWYLTPGYAP